MLQTLAAAAVVLGLGTGLSPAEDTKPSSPPPTGGTVKKVDAAKGVLTLAAGDQDVAVPITEDTRFIVLSRNGVHREFTGKAGLKPGRLEEGTRVQIVRDGSGKVTTVLVVPALRVPDRPLFTVGKVKKVDIARGVLTLTVSGQDKDVDVNVGEDTRIVVFQDTGRPKQFLGKAALKAGQISEGATAQVIRDDKGQARAIMVGSAPRGEGPLFTRGMVQKADPAKGVLVLKVSDQRGDREVEIRVTDETRFSSISAEGARKDFKGKAGLKAAQFQKGTRVSVLLEPDGAARVVLTTSPRPPEKGGK